ncbi:hypothetical protein [Heliothis virescens ascovirus 3j]|uniref:Uncharacterized protein n=1 Tax=Heliothis virescens ascovirus 3j TaxID=1561067 RepID=A0A2Z5UZD5_9VIRU|nr:hypothetical protein [Heliothis virescens ascovirus 3j]
MDCTHRHHTYYRLLHNVMGVMKDSIKVSLVTKIIYYTPKTQCTIYMTSRVSDFRLCFIQGTLTSSTPYRYITFGMTHNRSRGRTVLTTDHRYICVSAVEGSNRRLNGSGSRFGIRVKLVGPESAECWNVIVRLCLINGVKRCRRPGVSTGISHRVTNLSKCRDAVGKLKYRSALCRPRSSCDSGVTTDKESHSMPIRLTVRCTVSEPGS